MAKTSLDFDAIVIGAGGAGLMCAAQAGARERRVVVLEHANEPGKKILISGGGRCNFTNVDAVPSRYISQNMHFATSALKRYTAKDFVALVEGHGIAWHEKKLGQLFCDGSARQILKMLLDECEAAGVSVRVGETVSDISHADGTFRVVLGEQSVQAPALVIATGGASIPKMGATRFAYEVARQFGVPVVEPRPGLVPLTLSNDQVLFRELSGVSTDVAVSCEGMTFNEACLFTHKGLSGPAFLQISSYWGAGDDVSIDFLPAVADGVLLDLKRETPRAHLAAALGTLLPGRLAGVLAERIGVRGRLAEVPDKVLMETEAWLRGWLFSPSGTEGFNKAEVTVGGIDTRALSSKTMAVRDVPGLYFVGEAVDVTGWLGGYNFQWAWSSGWAAAQDL